MTDPPISTPKRKRGEDEFVTPITFTFDLSQLQPAEDGSNSPRSKVTHSFRGLALDNSGGGVTASLPTPIENEDQDPRQPGTKRQKPDEPMGDTVDVAAAATARGLVTNQNQTPQPDFPDFPEAQAPLAPGAGNLQLPEGSIQRTYPSINRLSESNSRRKKRMGSPPPRSRKPSALREQNDDEDVDEMEIVDPVRAALTWREDEITIYDPEDEDDDGTGINGVGFKPTPALAHARLMKRRQQMAEYRKREEGEARARRNQRRREAAAAASCTPQEPSSPSRRVRFGEPENYGRFVIS